MDRPIPRCSNQSATNRAWFKVPRYSAILTIAMLVLVSLLGMQGCGVSLTPRTTAVPAKNPIPPVTVAITPSQATLTSAGSQQFTATVSGASSTAVGWTIAGANAANGAISTTGLYVAPAVTSSTLVEVTATSVADPTAKISATVTITPVVSTPTSIVISPAAATVVAGTSQPFQATVSGLSDLKVQWLVNGSAGGDSISGTISVDGLYTAPHIDPGLPVAVSAVSLSSSNVAGSAAVVVANPSASPLSGVSYAKTRSSWDADMLPWIESLSGLTWDSNTRSWLPTRGWNPPVQGIGLQVYALEQALRPATRMAISRTDIALLEELAEFHMAMLAYRTTTVGTMLQNAPRGSVIFIDGATNDRTFAWYEDIGKGQLRIRECQQCNAQYLSTASRLLRAIAEMPQSARTVPLNTFAGGYAHFLVSEQLMRLLYGTTQWSYFDSPAIPQPVVAAWKFIASTGYEAPAPYRFVSMMTDMELWMIADAADAIAADATAPEFAILDVDTRSQLKGGVIAGVTLLQTKCHHEISPDGSDVLSLFAGDADGYADFAYSNHTDGPATPTVPDAKPGLSWDTSHAYRFPIIFRTLYETRDATGTSYPARNDLVALANTYVHLTSNGNAHLPDFNNYVDGWDGWLRVGYPDIPGGYPPHEYCNAMQITSNCETAGTLQGWGELAFLNPDLATLEQQLINLAFDDSASTTLFKDQHYYFGGQHYSANQPQYPGLMTAFVGDSSDLLQ